MKEVYILSAVRTPIGKFGGGLSSFSATQLGGFAIEEAVKRSGIDKHAVQEVVMGNLLQDASSRRKHHIWCGSSNYDQVNVLRA